MRDGALSVQAWLVPGTVVMIALALMLSGDSGRDPLRFDRGSIAAGEFWRLLSGRFVHLGVTHTLLNLAGLVLVWFLVGRAWTWRQWLLLMAASVAAIDAPHDIGRLDAAQTTTATAQLSNPETATKSNRLANFQSPTTEQGLEALVTKPADPSITNWKAGGYLDRVPTDPWGNPYQYLNPGNNGEIDIYTLGRDGRPGGEDIDADIGNWNLE